ncbi:MAG TPA: hypothetical protein VFI23_04440 [Rhizomicrobium sp.]|nr:hypothetical protein [Rhizomicrobium sp.]
MLKTTSAAIALLALANPALINSSWAAGCATPVEAAALKTAVMQQELMVAALQCHETRAYNRFVMSYREELQSSDAALKAFFVRRGGEHGEAGYDTFKTKAANLSALEQARHGAAFCADARALYAAAFANQDSLMHFVESRSATTDIGAICVESRPVLARTESRPALAAQPSVRVASTAQAADIAVGGVPTHSLPAIPYGRAGEVPPPPRATANRAEEDAARDDDQDDASNAYASADDLPPPPPRRWRYSDMRARDYGGYRPYGPTTWQQEWRGYGPPRYGWYQRDPYDR